MKNILMLVVKDVRKNIFFFCLFYSQIIIFGIIIIMALTELPQISRLNKHISLLEEHNVVTFKSYYKASNRIAQMPENVIETLIDIFDMRQIGFSTSEAYSYAIPEYPDLPVIIIVGNFNELYQVGLPQSPVKPQAFIGGTVDAVPLGASFTFGGMTSIPIRVTGKLALGSTFFYRTFETSLDEYVIIVTPYEKIPQLFGTFLDEELIQNTNLIQPTKLEIDKFVSTVNTSRIINVLPFVASQLFKSNYESLLYSQWFFLSFFSIAFIFNIVSIIANLINMINKNLRIYSIHYAYGCTKRKIFIWILTYTTFIITPPMFFIYYLASNGGLFDYFIGWTAPICLLIFILILLLVVLAYPFIKFKMTHVQDLMRRD